MSGDPCSGKAVVNSTRFNSSDFSTFIKYDYSFNNSTTCLISHLNVTGLEAGGVIPEELGNLTFLNHLYGFLYFFVNPISLSKGFHYAYETRDE
ncbi:hypothetical protein AAC387_Pa06g1705 [Persea americana]